MKKIKTDFDPGFGRQEALRVTADGNFLSVQ
jgi:hypothetical protein